MLAREDDSCSFCVPKQPHGKNKASCKGSRGLFDSSLHHPGMPVPVFLSLSSARESHLLPHSQAPQSPALWEFIQECCLDLLVCHFLTVKGRGSVTGLLSSEIFLVW